MIKSCVWEGLLTVSCQTNVSSSDSFNVSNVTVINQGPWQTSPVAAPAPHKKIFSCIICCFSQFLLSTCYVLEFKKLLDLRREA